MSRFCFTNKRVHVLGIICSVNRYMYSNCSQKTRFTLYMGSMEIFVGEDLKIYGSMTLISTCKSKGWLYFVLRNYIALAVFQPYRDLEAGDDQSMKFNWRGGKSNPAPLTSQAKSLTTRSWLLPANLKELQSFSNKKDSLNGYTCTREDGTYPKSAV